MFMEAGDQYEQRRSFVVVVLGGTFFCCVGMFCFVFSILVFLCLLQFEERRNPLCYIRLEP